MKEKANRWDENRDKFMICVSDYCFNVSEDLVEWEINEESFYRSCSLLYLSVEWHKV